MKLFAFAAIGLADCLEQGVEMLDLEALESMQTGSVKWAVPPRLAQQEFREESEASQVAAQNRVETDTLAGCQAGLGEKRLGHRRRSLPGPDRLERVIDRRRDACAETVGVGWVAPQRRSRNAVDAFEDDSLDLLSIPSQEFTYSCP